MACDGCGSEWGKLLSFVVGCGADELEWQMLSADYPNASKVMNGLDNSVVRVYDDTFRLEAKLKRKNGREDSVCFGASLIISLQLCNDQECLLPCKISFRI